MKITSIQVGPIMTNCYLLCDETAGVCALIDPGDDAARVARLVEQSGCTLQYILLTHGHFDHTSAVRPLLEQYPDVPVYIHEKDAVDTERGELLFRKVGPENQRYYKEGDTLPLGSLTLRVLETRVTPRAPSACWWRGRACCSPAIPCSAAPAAGAISPAATTGRCWPLWAAWRHWRGTCGCFRVTTWRLRWTTSAASTPTCGRGRRDEADLPRP